MPLNPSDLMLSSISPIEQLRAELQERSAELLPCLDVTDESELASFDSMLRESPDNFKILNCLLENNRITLTERLFAQILTWRNEVAAKILKSIPIPPKGIFTLDYERNPELFTIHPFNEHALTDLLSDEHDLKDLCVVIKIKSDLIPNMIREYIERLQPFPRGGIQILVEGGVNLAEHTFRSFDLYHLQLFLNEFSFEDDFFELIEEIDDEETHLELVQSVAQTYWLYHTVEDRSASFKEAWQDYVYLGSFKGLTNQEAYPSEFLGYLDQEFTEEDFNRDRADVSIFPYDGTYERALKVWRTLTVFFTAAEKVLKSNNARAELASTERSRVSERSDPPLPQNMADMPQRFFSVAAVETPPVAAVNRPHVPAFLRGGDTVE